MLHLLIPPAVRHRPTTSTLTATVRFLSPILPSYSSNPRLHRSPSFQPHSVSSISACSPRRWILPSVNFRRPVMASVTKSVSGVTAESSQAEESRLNASTEVSDNGEDGRMDSDQKPPEETRNEAKKLKLEELNWDNSFVRELPGDTRTDGPPRQVLHACYTKVSPSAVVEKPELVVWSESVAELLDLDLREFERPDFPLIFSGALPLKGRYGTRFMDEYQSIMTKKLGLKKYSKEIISKLLSNMAFDKVDYTICFRALSNIKTAPDLLDDELLSPLKAVLLDISKERKKAWIGWIRQYTQELASCGIPDEERKASMDSVNPKFVLRNYLCQSAIDAAEFA